ncbi:LOW QUALITY PROTEIN: cytochrome c oxidase assembly factor 1 homolog [Hyaena hyaena]|uniref:LOW QUALITY PROTEIN: cytochrome c oxidase assembly factor 1 homolog n=1 Tax=Hyaena hyaena TaxID=95912 RepID=UPI001920E99D|nr:LOW QUALITY PROTEIN: cytochrome c oxidase assembly factor 1 homolog [Hyaena hyaena]
MRERIRWEVRDEDAEAQKDQAPCSRSSATFPQILTLCTLLLESLKWTRQEAFSGASSYQLALEQLHSRPEASAALGPPLSVHCLQLTDQYNFVDIAEAQLKIPVSGSKSEGHLYVSSSRDAPFQRWHLQEVFLELKDGRQIALFKASGDTGDGGGR